MSSKHISYQAITESDLRKLCRFAQDYFARDRGIVSSPALIALCGRAACHHIDNKVGINNFTLCLFFPKTSTVTFTPTGGLEDAIIDFGKSKFGKSPNYPDFEGRDVNINWTMSHEFALLDDKRSIKSVIEDYLQDNNSNLAKSLASNAIIGLSPEPVFDKVLWDKCGK